MLWPFIILAVTLFVAYSNGANDNFKGVATLFGSGTASYRKALLWATVSTFAGSMAACFLAAKLVKTFSGKGLVPDSFLSNPAFLVSIMVGAGLTVFVASKAGIPISTTHSLTGALVGSGLVAAGSQLGFGALGKNFFTPLIASPFFSMALTLLIYPLFRWGRKTLGVSKNTCLCVGERIIPLGNLALNETGTLSMAQLSALDIMIDEKEVCRAKAVEVYAGSLFGIGAQKVLDFFHFLSAGAVSFARGLNDTPKIAAITITAGALGFKASVWAVALIIALGGILSARKVAEAMSHKITGMNHGQGFTANVVTAFLVIFASHLGMPVSTTHVSCGSLFGIGLVNGKANWKIIGGIVSAWVLTLPVAALMAGISFFFMTAFRSE